MTFHRPRPDSTLRVAAAVNLVAQTLIVVTGGLVRLTGSGLGCPIWPQCVPGSYTPVRHQAEGYHSVIEYANRTLTSVVGLAALALAASALWLWWRRREHRDGPPASRRFLGLALVPLVGVAGQAVLGGITVLTRLHPATVAAHFLLSMVLISASTVVLLVATDRRPAWTAPPHPGLRLLAAGVAAAAAAVLVLGTVVTGSGPHSGDADRPARFDLDPRTASWLHADAVWLFVGLWAALLVGLAFTAAPAAVRRRGWWLVAATAAQGVIGYTQYALGLPRALVALHLLGACLLVAAVTVLVHPLLRARVVAPAFAGPAERVPSAV
jgi:cytochrome c oxidase assembly protein subunit 15